MEDLENYPLLIDHLIQSEIPESLLLDGKVITCAKYDQKYAENTEHRIEEEFPEHIIGCKSFQIEKKVITVTSRNTLTIRKSSNLQVESKIQCDYFATSICSLIIGDSVESCHIFFGSVIGDLIDWRPNTEVKPIMRKGHKGMIFSIVSDSKRIFTISDDRTIRMWSISERENGSICTVFGHTARPFAISVDSINNKIYTGGIEQTLFCWKYDESSITLIQKTPLSIGVIRKITQIDKSTLAITSQNGDLLKLHVDKDNDSDSSVLKDEVISFAHLDKRLIVLTSKNELIVYETDVMDRIIFRCSGMKHMYSSNESVVAWQHNVLVVITETSVHRVKLSMNIISTTCFSCYVAIKSIDGCIQVYDFFEAENIRCLKRFRPENPSMIPAVFTVVQGFLILGTTHGELYHSDLTDEADESQLSLTRRGSYEIFGGKEVTCIRPIKKTLSFMTLGKTGIWSTMKFNGDKVEILNSRSFSAASRMAWPSKFIEWNNGKELLIVGFYGTSLIVWNSTTGLPVYETYCGGGHRVWQLNQLSDNTFNFDFVRDSELCRQKIDFNSKEYLISTAHSSPIVAASGSLNYLVTVSLDGHLSIANNIGESILTMFVGENLLCTDVFENGNEVYVLAGGGKSKLSVLRFNPKELQNHNVFWLRHVARPDEGRIVAVKACQVEKDHSFFTASYSSGFLEVFKIVDDNKNPLTSLSSLEIEDSLGIGAKMDYSHGQLSVGTSGSYILTYALNKDGELKEFNRMKLSDRSGVTSVTASSNGITYLGCDSGHVYQYDQKSITEIHSHLSTVVGIVSNKDRIHSVSLDCAVLSSSGSGSTPLRKPTIIDMPNGMVKTGESSIVIVGDGIQLIDNLH